MHGSGGRARRQVVPADLHVLLEHARHDRQHRAQPQRLLAHRVEIVLVARGHLVAQALQLLGVAHEPLDRPGERGRGGLMAGHQQGHQLVAQLLVAHRLAVLVAGLDQQREDVLPLGHAGSSRRSRISA